MGKVGLTNKSHKTWDKNAGSLLLRGLTLKINLFLLPNENTFWFNFFRKHPSKGVFWKRYSEIMQQNYKRTLKQKCNFNDKHCVTEVWFCNQSNRSAISIKLICKKSHFCMGVLLSICCIFSEHFFLITTLEGCFCFFPIILCNVSKKCWDLQDETIKFFRYCALVITNINDGSFLRK